MACLSMHRESSSWMRGRLLLQQPLSPLPRSAFRRLSLLAAALMIQGCTTHTVVTDTACTAFQPITYSIQDTAETVGQIRAHNRAWDALCKEA